MSQSGYIVAAYPVYICQGGRDFVVQRRAADAQGEKDRSRFWKEVTADRGVGTMALGGHCPQVSCTMGLGAVVKFGRLSVQFPLLVSKLPLTLHQALPEVPRMSWVKETGKA